MDVPLAVYVCCGMSGSFCGVGSVRNVRSCVAQVVSSHVMMYMR
jgi:hypothetical protein